MFFKTGNMTMWMNLTLLFFRMVSVSSMSLACLVSISNYAGHVADSSSQLNFLSKKNPSQLAVPPLFCAGKKLKIHTLVMSSILWIC